MVFRSYATGNSDLGLKINIDIFNAEGHWTLTCLILKWQYIKYQRRYLNLRSFFLLVLKVDTKSVKTTKKKKKVLAGSGQEKGFKIGYLQSFLMYFLLESSNIHQNLRYFLNFCLNKTDVPAKHLRLSKLQKQLMAESHELLRKKTKIR